MTNEQLKTLEDNLWDSANTLRAYGGLKASEYQVPILGLIFLKFTDNRYCKFEAEIQAEHDKLLGTRMEQEIDKIAIAKCGFYLPKDARFDYLLSLSTDESTAGSISEAMENIEKYLDQKFKDILPKGAYYEIEKKKADILPELLKTFSDIPKEADGDLFGKIYEYFLGKFALSEGQKGGEFFTPTSVVRFIVEVIEPYKGKIYDPACGSGGMFVQSARFLAHENQDLKDIYVYGQEFMGETVRLAKMNLLVNNLRGEITEVNSYEGDPYSSHGKFDFVMANPPFNVKSVKESTVKDDKRFYTYGLPKNKGKSEDKISDANYLWISLFATSLNEKGRAGFVMANSASDAGGSEYAIRKKLVDSGIVDCMVTMPSNMFFTVTLPATLWFFDKAKVNTERKDKILFLDARNVYHQIDRAHREWTEENQQNLAAIVRLYRGETQRYLGLIEQYLQVAKVADGKIGPAYEALTELLNKATTGLQQYIEETKAEKRTPAKKKALEEADLYNKLKDLKPATPAQISGLVYEAKDLKANKAQHKGAALLKEQTTAWKKHLEELKTAVESYITLWKVADKQAKLKNDKWWSGHELGRKDRLLEEALKQLTAAVSQLAYWHENIHWLQSRFPDARYQDITGLCKMADRADYVEQQDYSLNAGRYVGVEIEDDKRSHEEYITELEILNKRFRLKSEEAYQLSLTISGNVDLLCT